MFAALRSFFRPSGDPVGPRKGRRWDRTLRLFAFEFVVVVAGVLAAQALQSWAAERSQRASGRVLLAGARQNVQSFSGVLGFWPTMDRACARTSGGSLQQPARAGP